MKRKVVDPNTYASLPGKLSISKQKLKQLRPELYGIRGWLLEHKQKRKYGYSQMEEIREHIFYGDSQPAVVLLINPLIIAAYSDEFDCIVPLYFPKLYAEKYNLKEKTKLITINTYMSGTEIQKDIILGENNLGRWSGFSPIIAEFISDDIDLIAEKKKKINEELWEYVYKLGLEFRKKYPKECRDGRPIYSQIPAPV